MKLINNRLDYTKPWILPNVYLFTGNAVVRKDGALVMGRGAARQVRDSYKGIDLSFGALLSTRPNISLAWISLSDKQHIGWFRVKNHWMSKARIELIAQSTAMLKVVADKRPNVTFHMNYPGIGNGGLAIEQVSKVLELLPDNVWIYK